jgi:hypothetical protein
MASDFGLPFGRKLFGRLRASSFVETAVDRVAETG